MDVRQTTGTRDRTCGTDGIDRQTGHTVTQNTQNARDTQDTRDTRDTQDTQDTRAQGGGARGGERGGTRTLETRDKQPKNMDARNMGYT